MSCTTCQSTATLATHNLISQFTDQRPTNVMPFSVQNLLIDANFRTKVADFGLAGKKGKVGSPAWMSPEMLRGEVVTTAADVYSFAIVMYELYSRKDPYEGRPGHSTQQIILYLESQLLFRVQRVQGVDIKHSLCLESKGSQSFEA